ncbi:MAG TPA: BrnA antitoxin family protein [Devosia sp.]|nr:BrnA antitoxin family protein [Devosia sp.]
MPRKMTPDMGDPNVEFDEDNPEWTEEDFKRARPAHEILPPEILAAFPRTRGPQKSDKKIPVSIRLSPQVVDYFKSQGPGWQSRIDEVLKKAAGF